MREIKLLDRKKNTLNVCIWDRVNQPKGIVQILHGVNEHGERYQEFASFLNKHGYVVYLGEHKSQGKSRTEKDGDFVDFGYRGHVTLVGGMLAVKEQAKFDYPNLPIYVFGHSLGSMIVRYYLLSHENEYHKIILNGAGYQETKGLFFGKCIAFVLTIFGNRPSTFFDSMFRQTQYKLKEKVEMDHFIEWLTRDEMYTNKNKEDALLYKRLKARAFGSVLKMVGLINQPKRMMKQYKPSLDILLLSGTHDPSTDFGESTKRLAEVLEQIGVQVTTKLYLEGRHDTLQEINRNEVYADILQFLEEN